MLLRKSHFLIDSHNPSYSCHPYDLAYFAVDSEEKILKRSFFVQKSYPPSVVIGIIPTGSGIWPIGLSRHCRVPAKVYTKCFTRGLLLSRNPEFRVIIRNQEKSRITIRPVFFIKPWVVVPGSWVWSGVVPIWR